MANGPDKHANRPAELKAEGAFRTIREVSDEIGVPAHVLRFWETRFPQLKPLQRGGNRRYYRPTDVELAAAIHILLHKRGLTVKGVQMLIQEHGAPQLPELAAAGGLMAAPAVTQPDIFTAAAGGQQAQALTPAMPMDILQRLRDRLAAALLA